MNIGIDIRPLMESNRTGVGEYTYELLNALFEIDNDNQYFLFYNSGKDVSRNIPLWNKKCVHYVKFNWPNKLFNLGLLLFRYPKLDKLTGHKLDYFFSPNLSFTALSPNVRHILTIHDLSFEYFPDCFGWKRRLWHKVLFPKRACQKADIILTPSESTKQDVMEKYWIKEDKIKVVYPGISSVFKKNKTTSFEEVKHKYNLPEKFVLFLGTIEPRKNIIGIISAFQKISSRFSPLDKLGAPRVYPVAKLVIAGGKGWEYKPIMNLIAKQNNVQYIGYVEAEDKPALYSLADLFVYPSLYEGFGIPLLEAMASGIPAIASNRSSMPEVTGGGAYLVNPNNIGEIAQGMELLLADQKAVEFLKDKGKARAQDFSWEKSAREFLNILK